MKKKQFSLHRFAYVQFRSHMGAKSTMNRMQGEEVSGQKMHIEFFKMNEQDEVTINISQQNPSRTLYVGNLSAVTTEDMLKSSFETALHARMPTNHNTGMHRG